MNYPQEKYDEVRAATRHYAMSNETIDRILSIFATVPQVTEQDAEAILRLYRNLHSTAEKDMQAAVNSVLAKQGPVIAATPADGMVSLEDALADFTLPEFTCLPSGPVATPFDWVNMAFQFRRSLLIKPEPTVTLVDAAEGRTLEVPARAVHKMEYPEDVTYTHDPWANKDVCNLCGAYVYDQTKHTAWHGREGVL